MAATMPKSTRNHLDYDYNTGEYLIAGNRYQSYEEARSKQWQCDKCKKEEKFFPSIKKLRQHKVDVHSY